MGWFGMEIKGDKDKLIRLLDGIIIGCFTGIVLVILFAEFCI